METQTQYRDVKTAVATVFQSTSPEQAIFRKEGEYWAIGYGRKSFRLKDTKGLGYLAHLLRHPAAEFHVLDLAGGVAGQREDDETNQSAHGLPRGEQDLEKAGIHIGSLGDAGEMLDEQAKARLPAPTFRAARRIGSKPRSWEMSGVPKRRSRKSMH